jgi:hypothetical protein
LNSIAKDNKRDDPDHVIQMFFSSDGKRFSTFHEELIEFIDPSLKILFLAAKPKKSGIDPELFSTSISHSHQAPNELEYFINFLNRSVLCQTKDSILSRPVKV